MKCKNRKRCGFYLAFGYCVKAIGENCTYYEEERKFDMEYCHYDYEDKEHDCLDYMECDECPYYYADID